jgi:hypothetical protein
MLFVIDKIAPGPHRSGTLYNVRSVAVDRREYGGERREGATAEVDGWELPTEKGSRADGWSLRRSREVEIHHVDLAAGYTPDRIRSSATVALCCDSGNFGRSL